MALIGPYGHFGSGAARFQAASLQMRARIGPNLFSVRSSAVVDGAALARCTAETLQRRRRRRSRFFRARSLLMIEVARAGGKLFGRRT